MRRWNQVILIVPCDMTKILRPQAINDNRSLLDNTLHMIIAYNILEGMFDWSYTELTGHRNEN